MRRIISIDDRIKKAEAIAIHGSEYKLDVGVLKSKIEYYIHTESKEEIYDNIHLGELWAFEVENHFVLQASGFFTSILPVFGVVHSHQEAYLKLYKKARGIAEKVSELSGVEIIKEYIDPKIKPDIKEE